jgi:hypothetical protein
MRAKIDKDEILSRSREGLALNLKEPAVASRSVPQAFMPSPSIKTQIMRNPRSPWANHGKFKIDRVFHAPSAP